MRFVSETTSASIITHDMAYQAVRDALVAASQGDATSFPVVIGHGSSPADRFTIKAAATGDLAGLKVGSYWPGNIAQGLPCHNSTILLFDQTVGQIRTAMAAGIVNAYRTAAADAVAATHLARPDCETLTVFGTGNQARYEIEALIRVLPLRRVLVVGRDPDRAAAFCARLDLDGVDLRPEQPRAACEAADVLVTATASRAPLFDADWVRPGTHLASMGSDGAGKQELPVALFARADLFCDAVEQSRAIGEFQHAPSGMALTAIGDVVAGLAQGRRDTAQITIFDSSGLSLQDLYVARAILAALDAESG